MNLNRTLLMVICAVGWVTLPVSASHAEKTKDPVKPALARIALLERTRDIERTAWRKFVRDENPVIRAAAIRGLGRTQDMRGIQFIKNAMKDPETKVRYQAVFAYGQLPKAKMGPLSKRLAVEADEEVREAIVEAMGKRAGPGDIAALAAVADGESPALTARALIGLGLLARREKGVLPILNGQRVAGWLGHTDPKVRYGAAYLLLRANKMLDKTALAATAQAAKDADPEVRALAMRSSSRFKRGKALRDNGLRDTDWRVRVEAIRAAGKLKDDEFVAAALDAYVSALIEGVAPPSTEELHPGLTAAQTALSLPPSEASTAAATRLLAASHPGKSLISDPESGTVTLGNSHLHCAASALVDRAQAKVKLTPRCGARDYPTGLREEWIVKASTGLPDAQRMDLLVELYQKAGTLGRMAVVRALPELKSQPDAGDLLLLGLADPDSAVTGTAAELAADLKPQGIVEALIAAYHAMYPAREYEAVQSVFDALGQLKAKKAMEILERHTTDTEAGVKRAANEALKEIGSLEKRMGHRQMIPPPPEFFGQDSVDVRLAEPSKVIGATLHTSKGLIVIDLFEKTARETVKNFARLAGRKYYDGLMVHRVVPGFVIQSGDPKGSGWGGPGHTIGCEVNPHRYVRGSVGMALAGKDTGGSQFFITQATHPHLDGGYTVFGTVTEGMPAVDAMTIGDRILRVELHRAE